MRLHYYDGCVVWYVYSDVWLVCMDTSGSVLATQGRIQGGSLWGCNPPKALDNQRRIKESSSAAQALGVHAPYARGSAKKVLHNCCTLYRSFARLRCCIRT